MFSLQQLETLIFCVECGSFSAAARKLGKAQSAISTMIANLEIDTGIEIFDRSTRNPTLTPHGERLYLRAQILLTQAQDIDLMLKSFESNVESHITIFLNELLLTPKLFEVMAEFNQQFPHTELGINIVENDKISSLVSQHESSIGFMLCEDSLPHDVELGLVGYLPLTIAASTSHPLVQQDKLHLNQLQTYRQIMFSTFQSVWNKRLSPYVSETNSLPVLINILTACNAWGVIPQHVVDRNSSLTKLSLAGEEKDWLIHVDRVTSKNKAFGFGMTWLYEQSTRIFETS